MTTTSTPPDPNPTNPLGTFAGLVGVLAIFLFFTGWVYRWAYFGFFALDVNSLTFPPQSFLLVPIQVILGDQRRLLWLAPIVVGVVLLTQASLCLLAPSSTGKTQFSRDRYLKRFRRVLQPLRWLTDAYLKCWDFFKRSLERFPRLERALELLRYVFHLLLSALRRFRDVFPLALRRDFVIVVWLLVTLFWLARWHGVEDAWRDAVNPTSTRPIVTLVSPNEKLALGVTLNDELISDDTKKADIPPLKNLRIFGDVSKFRKLYKIGINDSDPVNPIVWRLLIENGNWLYLFSALPKREDDHPAVVAVNTGDGRVQSVILTPPKP